MRPRSLQSHALRFLCSGISKFHYGPRHREPIRCRSGLVLRWNSVAVHNKVIIPIDTRTKYMDLGIYYYHIPSLLKTRRTRLDSTRLPSFSCPLHMAGMSTSTSTCTNDLYERPHHRADIRSVSGRRLTPLGVAVLECTIPNYFQTRPKTTNTLRITTLFHCPPQLPAPFLFPALWNNSCLVH